MRVLEAIKGRLIVSCQASEEEPLHGALFMQKMAQAAIEGGAAAIRANGVADVTAIRAITDLPIIGIHKEYDENHNVLITPTFEHAARLSEAGADIVALDATMRKRPDGNLGVSIIRRIKSELNILVMADISTVEEGIAAYEAGADMVGTTLSGYTEYTVNRHKPDYELITELSTSTGAPVVAEGHIWTPEEAVKALQFGAHTVVVGTAITRPQEITKRFATYMQNNQP